MRELEILEVDGLSGDEISSFMDSITLFSVLIN